MIALRKISAIYFFDQNLNYGINGVSHLVYSYYLKEELTKNSHKPFRSTMQMYI